MAQRQARRTPRGNLTGLRLVRMYNTHCVYNVGPMRRETQCLPMFEVYRTSIRLLRYMRLLSLGRSPRKNCKNDLDDQTLQELEQFSISKQRTSAQRH